MKLKKLVALILALVTALSLVACGNAATVPPAAIIAATARPISPR